MNLCRLTIAVILAAVLAGCIPTRLHSAPQTSLSSIPFQYGVGGRVTTQITVSQAQWKKIETSFHPAPRDAAAEREAIGAAVLKFQLLAADQTPTGGNRGYTNNPEDATGVMDCLDVSKNTTTYLRVMEERGLIKYHEVLEPISRFVILFCPVHRTAAIRDRADDEVYVVDPWFHPNSHAPTIEPLEKWLDFDDPPEEE